MPNKTALELLPGDVVKRPAPLEPRTVRAVVDSGWLTHSGKPIRLVQWMEPEDHGWLDGNTCADTLVWDVVDHVDVPEPLDIPAAELKTGDVVEHHGHFFLVGAVRLEADRYHAHAVAYGKVCMRVSTADYAAGDQVRVIKRGAPVPVATDGW